MIRDLLSYALLDEMGNEGADGGGGIPSAPDSGADADSGADGGGVDDAGGEDGGGDPEIGAGGILEEEPANAHLDFEATPSTPAVGGDKDFNNLHYQWADHFGIEARDLNKDFTVASLERMIVPAQRQQLEMQRVSEQQRVDHDNRMAFQQQQYPPQQQQPPHQNGQPPNGQNGQRQRPKPIGNFAIEDPAKFLQDADTNIPAMNQHNNNRMTQFERVLSQVLEHQQQNQAHIQQQQQISQQQEAQRAEMEFHQILDEMNDPRYGNSAQLTAATAQSRDVVKQHVLISQSGYLDRGVQLPLLRDMVEYTHGGLFGNSISNQQLQAVADSTQRQTAQSGAMPSGDSGPPLSQTQRAERAVAESMRRSRLDEQFDVEQEAALFGEDE